MRYVAFLALLTLLLPDAAHARSRGDHTGWRACHCDRYLNPHRGTALGYGGHRRAAILPHERRIADTHDDPLAAFLSRGNLLDY